MKLEHLYDYLAGTSFQDRNTGNLFFPVYIYTYPPEEEYQIRAYIDRLVDQLHRPNNYLNCMVMNIFEEMIQFLKDASFMGQSVLDDILALENNGTAQEADDYFQEEILREEFIDYIGKKITAHFGDRSDQSRAYLIIYGFGDAFPHLRASSFLKRTERLVKDFKMVVFYPGEYDPDTKKYLMFGQLGTDNVYRATRLNEL